MGYEEDELQHLRLALEAETERRLELQRQLERTNAEFEEFVSVAAHDLRQSLRDVTSYSELLAEGYAARLDSDAVGFLERIQTGAAKMQILLSDVVEYWAGVPGEPRDSQTDLEAALAQALLRAGKEVAERGAIITNDPLPTVSGDFQTLTKVLLQLIRNAIEYCDAPPARVHISARREDVDWVISVRDNGPGIEPAFQDRIFRAFKRLHGKEYPGSGLGLAFCKKAILWHGGRIWLDSRPGQGSIFYFSLPLSD